MNKFFLIIISMTLINTMTMYYSRNINNQIDKPEIENEVVEESMSEENQNIEEVEEIQDEENIDNTDSTDNTTESPVEDEEIIEDEITEESEEEGLEESSEILPDMDIELTEEEKALVFKYIGKIDITYLMSLTKEGITEEENLLIIEHLKEKLTAEEYEEVEDLIIRFLYSLE